MSLKREVLEGPAGSSWKTPQKELREAREPRKAGMPVYMGDGITGQGSAALPEVAIVVSLCLFLDMSLSFACAV